jgi:hypothetical protein
MFLHILNDISEKAFRGLPALRLTAPVFEGQLAGSDGAVLIVGEKI